MRVLIDIDGILCEQVEVRSAWKVFDALPRYRNIEMVNDLYRKGNTIILYTARVGRELDAEGISEEAETIKWLRKHEVLYHKIVFNKPWCDWFVDDRATTLEELSKKGE